MTTRRRTGVVSVALLTGLGVTFAGAHVIAPDWSRKAGLDVWNLPAASTELQHANAKGADLEARHRQWLLQKEASEHVVDLLTAGDLDLATATNELIAINAGRIGFDEALLSAFPEGRTHRQRMARYAVTAVRRLLANDPVRQSVVVSQLTRELAVLDREAEARTGLDAIPSR